MNKILVATDGSAGADRAIDFAAQLAKDMGATLVIINVIGAQSGPETVIGQFTRAEHAWIRDRIASASAKILQEARDRASALGATMIRLESRDGDAAQAVLDFAEEVAADVVVVGKRGAGRVSGLLLGSVSQKLVSLASKVVIVVP
jgi:nucleotide-binding universal stress UspA family protein